MLLNLLKSDRDCGPCYTNINNTEFAIKNFLKAIDPTLGVKYIDQETFFVYRKGVCNNGI